MPQRELNSERIKKRQGTKKKEAKNEQPNVEISSERCGKRDMDSLKETTLYRGMTGKERNIYYFGR